MANLRSQISRPSKPINAIVVADDGVLYTASDDATVRVWRRNFCSGDIQPHALTVTLPAKYSPVKTLTLNPDGGVMYGRCKDVYIHYWLIKGWFSGQLQYGGPLQGHTHAVMCLTTVGNLVVSGSADSTSRVWAREQDGQYACLAILQGHRGPIKSVAAFPVGGWIMRVIRMVAQFALEVQMECLKCGVSGAPASSSVNRDSNQIGPNYFETTF